jgi:myo-inositol-1(or 4)-monophosphatase
MELFSALKVKTLFRNHPAAASEKATQFGSESFGFKMGPSTEKSRLQNFALASSRFVNLNKALSSSVGAAKLAGALMRKNLRAEKKANEVSSHDIKLELDVRCQNLIERKLHRAFPDISFLGEEGDSGEADSQYRWVVDPIDGTVNFAYGIPHACVSIALQVRTVKSVNSSGKRRADIAYETLVGVVYDPFQNELWTAIRGQNAKLNGRKISASKRRDLGECIVTVGFAKDRESLECSLPNFIWLARRVRKIRIMGAAALGLTYVATGRLDAYLERGVSIWDVAAGGLIIQCAGGRFWTEPAERPHKLRMIASNGLIHQRLPKPR